MRMMKYSATKNEKLIFQHKSLHDLSRHKLDIQTFNVLTAIDGKRSVEDLIRDEVYDKSFLAEKIQLLLRFDLIEPINRFERRTNLSFFDQPTMMRKQPAKGAEVKQITNKLDSPFFKLINFRKMPFFWCVAGCGLAALLLISVPITKKGLKSDATGSLQSSVLGVDGVDELAAKFTNIESKSPNADQAQANGQVRGTVQSTEPSAAVSPAPFQAPAARPADDQTEEIEVAFNETGSLPPPAPGLNGVDELATKFGKIESKSPEADQVQANGQGKDAVQSTALSAAVSPAPFQAPAARPVEDQHREIEFDYMKDFKDALAHPEQVETEPLPAKVADGPLAQKSVTAPLVKSKWPYESLKKKPPISKLPNLTVKKITSETHPVSDTAFLHYLDQTGQGSNWKEILVYASRLWRFEAPVVEKYSHFSEYLENYNKYDELNRLAIHSASCTLHQLKVFNMPAILEFRHPRQKVTKYLVIKSIDYQKAALSNGKSEDDIIITHYQLDRFWSGISHIPWKKVIRSADVINTKSQPATVIELKAYLNSVGFHNLGDPETYNQRTASAIKQIQTRFGIAPTGVVDVETHAAFNRYRERIHKRAGLLDKL